MIVRLILLKLLVICSIGAYGQLDTIHYLPPLFGRTNISQHYISISTMSNNNVTVDIFRGDGTLIQNTSITSATPALILLGAGAASQGIVVEAGLNTVNATDGIIVRSSEPTFVNIRHVHNAQGLCLTSKGRFALGTAFRSGHLYTNQNVPYVKAHQISVMATSDNTVVDFLGFSPNVKFKNTAATGNTSNAISVTLDKGESYVIAAYLDEPGATGNINDVNGTKITSTKPIAVNTGSWLAGATTDGRDIGVDQITPLDVIGTEYVFSEGNGPAANERPCVVAEYNNTQVFINGALTPSTTLNAGDYYFIPNASFSANGNMYVRTSQPSYLYQSLSGTDVASNGLNFIPPIRCNGNTDVIIPNVDLVGIASVSITARTGASVYINGSTIALGGAQTVTGNSSWVTYDVPGGTGNFTVSSDSVINVALLTLDGPRGSAGYFSGFGALQELSRGDSTDFELCHTSTNSFVELNIEGPYLSITPTFVDPSLGGTFTVNSIVGDTINFTYTNLSPLALIDTVELEICKISSCSGTIVDTFCTVSSLIFDKHAAINAGIGDSIIICQDTSSIDLFSILTGNPPNTGNWIDEDQSGLLFNGIFQTNIATPGIYHYTYLVNGPLSCYDSSVVTINVLPYSDPYCCPIDPSFLTQNISCNGDSSGFIQIFDPSANQFSIDGGVTFQTNGTFTNLSAGTYNVRVEFMPGCSFDTIINITEPSALTATFLADSVLCFNGCDGEITVSASGGTLPYSFQINGMPAQTLPVFNALCTGNYIVSVTDANNCFLNQNVQIEEPTLLNLIINSVTDATCSSPNGNIALSGQGGSPNYTYSINGGAYQSSSTFTNLLSGSYNVNIQDLNNCINQATITVNNASGPLPNIDTLIDAACFSDSNGRVIIGVNGGALPYQFSLNGGQLQNSNVFDSLAAGNYTANVTDNNGCNGQVAFTISEPTQISISNLVENTLCYNDCSGKIFLDVTGSNGPYTYSIDGSPYSSIPFAQFDTILNRCANNNINISIRDSSNCITNSFVNITEPDSIEIIPTITNPSCFYSCDGKVLLQTVGGTGNIEFSIDNGLTYQSVNQFLNLCGNTHTIQVRDVNQCINSDTVVLVSPLEFTVDTISIVHTTCGNSDGFIEVEVNTPIHPNYTFTNITTGASVIDSSSALFSNLTSGIYTIFASDSSGCNSDTIFVGINDESLSLNIDSSSITNIDCFGLCTGSFSVVAGGGNAPYQYNINNGLYGNSPSFSNLCATNYIVSVQDDSGCIETVQLEIFEPNQLSFLTSNLDVDCFGDCLGEINFTNNIGGTKPYTFSIDNGISYASDSSFTNLCAGQFDLILRDNNNCEISSIQQITQNTELMVSSTSQNLSCNGSGDGMIVIAASGGVPNYQYSIDNGTTFTTNSSYSNLNAGTYYIHVSDSRGCVFYDTVLITEPLQNGVSITKVENLCSDQCTGELVINAIGGTMPYLYSVDNGTSFQTTNAFTNLCSGQYPIKVIDNNNCQINILDSLEFIDTLSYTTILSNSNCDMPTGSITILAAGGTPTYVYSVDGANYSPNSVVSNLNAGTYNVYVRDANDCEVSDQLIINNFSSPQIDSIQQVLPCHGICNGELVVYATGGGNNYEFSLDGITYQNSNQFTGVCGNSYLIRVRDGNGCSDNIDYTLPEPDTISFVATASPILCNGDQNGEIALSAQGGIGQLNYVFNSGIPTSLSNFTQLGVGTYTIQIIDEIGCSVQFDTVLTQPDEIQISFNETNPTCFGDCNGSIQAIVVGGTPSNGTYDYSWSQSTINSNQINNVCAGFYSLIVKDSNNCIADSINFELTQPVFPMIDSIVAVGVNCFGSPIGSSIAAYAANGSLFSFDGGSTYTSNNILSHIPTGTYWVQIQDANACQGDSVKTYVPTPQALSGFVGPDAIICPGELVEFSAIAVGGTAPYQYNWNNGNNNQVSFSENIYADTTYFVEITDANGCSFTTDNREIILSLPPTITSSNDTVICPNQSVYLWAKPDDKGHEYTFNWSVGTSNTNHYITPTILNDTVFYILITDECNLTAFDSIKVDVFAQPVIDFQSDSIYGCAPHVQEYSVNISENAVFGDIEWYNTIGVINSSNNNGLSISYDYPGNDNLFAKYTSIDGCEYEVDFDTYISINPTPTADFLFTPKNPTNYDEVISFKNTSSDYKDSDWLIDNQKFNTNNADLVVETIENIYSPISACLKVSNEEKCVDEICKYVSIEVDQLIFVPNSFTPSDNYNAIFKADGTNIDLYGFHMTIYNRWGEIVFESYNIDRGWDGTYAGNELSTGVFTWKIDAASKSDPNKVNHLVGQVLLLR